MRTHRSGPAIRWAPETLVAAGVAALGALVLLVTGFDGPGAVVIGLAVALAAGVALLAWLALALRDRRRALAEFAERAARDGALAERIAIARDLHDLASHHLGAITVRAAVARHVADTDPDEPARALADIDGLSRAATAELRRLVELLRGAPAVSADHGSPAPTAPSPGLADLAALIDGAAARGLDARLDLDVPTDLDASVQLAAYRIVQESLTNAARHAVRFDAEPITVDVRVTLDGDALAVRIRDSNAAAISAAPPMLRAPSESASAFGGHGIDGMRERAELLGGHLAAGPADGGAWLVEARLPIGAP